MTEFNLSERLMFLDEEKGFTKEDVKEFIRLLREEMVRREKLTIEKMINKGITSKERDWLHKQAKNCLSGFIDKLAGEKLK